MMMVIKGFPRVVVYLDDLLVKGSSEQEHLATHGWIFSQPVWVTTKEGEMKVYDTNC